MGADPYYYVVAYHPDLEHVLQQLRQREFQAGRYRPVISDIEFPITARSPSPGPLHASIDDALRDAADEGTGSILDIAHISDELQFMAASPLGHESLTELYGTHQPTRVAVEAKMDFFDQIERGCACYIVLYREGIPAEVLFAGYSID